MNIRLNGPTLTLDRCQTVELIDAAGVVASVKSGCLWITQEHDQRDIVLVPGDSWTLDRNGLTLVQAEEPSRVTLVEPVPRRRGILRALESRLVAWIERLGERLARVHVPYY